ncbi:hypothetical protein Smp_045920.1 [Schistosoma mansoni]|uniref:hypothetical protein n=1 Tax=Schistosoma mansoni TaxID=6183 RepID=UPI0001A6392A|nr:hypothetical protein Smp_045920.1 [Schistosoma mansoni]|eukprot:XP_018654998.1 hypothetical protein Smp_045920.1 [Schistosoma mansoni]
MARISVNGIKAVSDNGNQSTNDDVTPTSIFHWKCYQDYFRTFPAMVKLCELLCVFIAFIISFLDKNFLLMGGSWLTVTTALSFLVTSFFLVFHLFLLHRFITAPWCLIELAAYVIVCILVFSNGVLSAAYSHLSGIIIAETVRPKHNRFVESVQHALHMLIVRFLSSWPSLFIQSIV